MNQRRLSRHAAAGFTLVEVMVALVLGLLLTGGIVSIFQATASTNRVQHALARVQENGRYAVARLNSDLRAAGGQYCSNAGSVTNATFNAANAEDAQQGAWREPRLLYGSFRLPDWASPGPTFTAPAPPLDLSARFYVQGYDCDASGCQPQVPALPATLPVVGDADGNRVRGSDVLVLRQLRSSGWEVVDCTLTPAPLLRVRPAAASSNPPAPADPPFDITAGQIAMMSDCDKPQIFGVGGVTASTVLAGAIDVTPDGEAAAGGFVCPASTPGREVRLFNVSDDFVTITYYLRLRADQNPDAPGRLVPVLVRREVTTTQPGNVDRVVEQELVQGVERLDFLYGIHRGVDRITYLSAREVDAAGGCSAQPGSSLADATCGWRTVHSIETHLLLDTVDNHFGLVQSDSAYRYSIDGPDFVLPPADLAGPMPLTNIAAGRMMRREFVSLIANRNFSP